MNKNGSSRLSETTKILMKRIHTFTKLEKLSISIKFSLFTLRYLNSINFPKSLKQLKIMEIPQTNSVSHARFLHGLLLKRKINIIMENFD